MYKYTHTHARVHAPRRSAWHGGGQMIREQPAERTKRSWRNKVRVLDAVLGGASIANLSASSGRVGAMASAGSGLGWRFWRRVTGGTQWRRRDGGASGPGGRLQLEWGTRLAVPSRQQLRPVSIAAADAAPHAVGAAVRGVDSAGRLRRRVTPRVLTSPMSHSTPAPPALPQHPSTSNTKST